MKRLAGVAAVLLVTGLAAAQTTATGTTTTTVHHHRRERAERHRVAQHSEEIDALRQQMQEQQTEIDALKDKLADRDQQLSTAEQSNATAQQAAAAASQKADAAAQAAQQSADQVNTLQNQVTAVQAQTAATQQNVAAEQTKIQDEVDHPMALHYKGITITPVAFMAFEGVWRQHAVNSDINTPFNNIPFPSANEGHVDEINFSGRQSRLGALFQGDAGSYKLSGYDEMDFLGTGTTSNNNQSNSYVMRQRQIWGQLATQGGFAVTGGQMWSLVTEDRRGTDNRTEILPQTIDPQYMVGFTWTRQPGIRIQQRFGDYQTGAFTIAASAEQAQITNFTAEGTNPADYFFGGVGQNGGLYNAAGTSTSATTTCTTNATTGATTCSTSTTPSYLTTYANNPAPDIMVKAAFDEPAFHVEIGGIGRWLRDEYFPVTWGGTSASPSFSYNTTQLLSNTKTAGGVYGAARAYFGKFAEVGVQAMAGTGIGRYGSAQLADATLRPDETLEPIRSYHGLLSIDLHPTKKLEAFAYYGGEYAQRTVYTTPDGTLVGYGPQNLSDTGCYNLPTSVTSVGNAGSGGSLSATSCSSPTRYIQEAMGGFIYRVVDSPKYGRLQYWVTYSYLQRNLWSGVGSSTTPSGPRATDPMIHVSMRYYIP